MLHERAESLSADEAMPRSSWIPPERYPLYERLIFALFVLFLPPLFASTPQLFDDGDVSWHIAAGRWMLEHGSIPSVDPFSYPMAGQPWVAHEWLAEIIYSSAFEVAGYSGLAAVVTLALMALNVVVFLHLRGRVGPVALMVSLAAMAVMLSPFLLARPHVLAWPFVAAWTAALMASRERERSPPLPLVLIMFGWANLHASFLIGFVVAACIALDAIISSRWNDRLLKDWMIFGLASFIAALLNVNGIEGLLHPVAVSNMKALPAIGEWMASSPQAAPMFYVVLLGGLAAVLVRKPRFLPGEILLLLASLALAFLHFRHQSIFAILSVLIVAPKLASVCPGARQLHLMWLVAVAITAISVVGVRAAVGIAPQENFANPRGLIAHVPDPLRDLPVFNEYDFGGPLILAGIDPYIDGRTDMYGDAFFGTYRDIIRGDAGKFDCIVRRYGIRWTMIRHSSRPLLSLLDTSPHWRRIYSDPVGVLHVRTTALPANASTSRC